MTKSADFEQHLTEACQQVEAVITGLNSVSDATVQRDQARARTAGRFPILGEAVAKGEVIPENLDILARISSRMTAAEIDVLAERDNKLTTAASRLGVDSFRKRVQRYRDKIRKDHGQTAEQMARAETFASVSTSRDNQTYRINGVFDPLQGTAVDKALRLEYRRLCDELGSGHGMTADNIAAQALHDLIVRGSNTLPTADNNQPGVLLQVITGGETLASGAHDNSIMETVDGIPIGPGTLGQLACDCVLERIDSLPDGEVNASRKSRTATSSHPSRPLFVPRWRDRTL